jgi:hypothetical protein
MGMQSLNETPSKGVKDSKDVPKRMQSLRIIFFPIIILHQAFFASYHHTIMHHIIIHHIISHQPESEKNGNCSLYGQQE